MSGAGRRVGAALLQGFRGLRYTWVMFGAALLMLWALETCYRVQGRLRYSLWSARSAESARHPDEGLPWHAGYLEEERASGVVDWWPYVYHRRRPFDGRYINVDSSGLRHTVQTVSGAPDTVRVFLFGGSTMFGVSQRDSNTIASVVSSRLAARQSRETTFHVTNFGQSGYVFTQEVIELLLQLRAGARPDVVVFYDGLNEVSSAVQNGIAGWPMNEDNRARDFDLGRAVYSVNSSDAQASAKLVEAGLSRLRIFQRLNLAIGRRGSSAVMDDTVAHSIATTYAETARLVEALARQYGFRALYIWQPSLHHTRKRLTPYEARLQALLDADPFQQRQRRLHALLPPLVAAAMAEVAPGRFLDISDVFATDTLAVYTDAVGHNTERAVPAIVEAFAPGLFDLLPTRAKDANPN